MPKFAYDIVRKLCLMIYKDLIEYNILSDLNVPLLRCVFFVSKLKDGDIIITGQNLNYQTFSNLQLRPLLKTYFHSFNNDLRDTSCEKISFVYVATTRLVIMFRRPAKINSDQIYVTR